MNLECVMVHESRSSFPLLFSKRNSGSIHFRSSCNDNVSISIKANHAPIIPNSVISDTFTNDFRFLFPHIHIEIMTKKYIFLEITDEVNDSRQTLSTFNSKLFSLLVRNKDDLLDSLLLMDQA